MLANLGHRTTCCADGASAIDAFAYERFDVIFLDVNMPGMDGKAVAAELRRREAAQTIAPSAIVFVTADATFENTSSDDDRSHACLLKPFSQLDVERLLTQLMERTDEGIPEESEAAIDLSRTPRVQLIRRLGDNQALLSELVLLFLEEAPKQFAKLEIAADENSTADIANIAHLLQGQLAMLEQSSATLVLKLEMAARRRNSTEVERLMKMLRRSWPQILHEAANLAVAEPMPIPSILEQDSERTS